MMPTSAGCERHHSMLQWLHLLRSPSYHRLVGQQRWTHHFCGFSSWDLCFFVDFCGPSIFGGRPKFITRRVIRSPKVAEAEADVQVAYQLGFALKNDPRGTMGAQAARTGLSSDLSSPLWFRNGEPPAVLSWEGRDFRRRFFARVNLQSMVGPCKRSVCL